MTILTENSQWLWKFQIGTSGRPYVIRCRLWLRCPLDIVQLEPHAENGVIAMWGVQLVITAWWLLLASLDRPNVSAPNSVRLTPVDWRCVALNWVTFHVELKLRESFELKLSSFKIQNSEDDPLFKSKSHPDSSNGLRCKWPLNNGSQIYGQLMCSKIAVKFTEWKGLSESVFRLREGLQSEGVFQLVQSDLEEALPKNFKWKF